MDIGDAEFTDLTNYRFAIDAVPEWPGGSTAIPTDRDDESEESFMLKLSLLWMAFSFIVGTWLEHWDVHRLSHKGVGVLPPLSLTILRETPTTFCNSPPLTTFIL